MIGTSATLWLVNISFRFSKFLSESDKKRWEFVSNNFAGEPAKKILLKLMHVIQNQK